MNHEELDQVYTSMAQAVTRAGESRAPLFLSILGLSLLSRLPSAQEAKALLDQAEAASLEDGAVANYSACAPTAPTSARPT
ncbi:hypothetical protein [Achromobacter sp. NFACC18-2]|uniref:hypothetical protein n=1 Tax=Achromobacter sp. NFACC18-2 TaxID=1564112 RepID=UPI0008BFCB3C|nr:hypothetical protein [Achromobacter sp. NFACC18-2]SEJ83480.1 hypothetical protein SAMN03159494_03486 [Achromobacter sp. NFACC18-2]